jgi:methylenetetrahydrofolate dehydrogenase (NADP+)/methenyltetrahydrofolate cyclohydrolase
MPADASEEDVLKKIEEYNSDESIHGILVQLPLPPHIDEKKVQLAILPQKDVDAFHPMNVGAIMTGDEVYLPCTPAGVIRLLEYYNIDTTGKNCVILGRSNIVGKPMFHLMLEKNATVTVCHSKTKNLKEVCKQADILIIAIGKPRFITKEYVKDGAVVIDVGIHRDENNKLCGDVDFAEVEPVCSAITPVPGGVGPMTICMLMKNCVEAMKVYSKEVF